MMTLEEARKKIKPLDEEKMETARKRWDSIAKPLHSLGKMEDLITQIVGITGEVKLTLAKKHWLPCAQTTELWKRELPRLDRK